MCVAAAPGGLAILLVTIHRISNSNFEPQECLANGPAWDTLTWFAALIAMAAYLNKFGFIPWFSNRCVQLCTALHAYMYVAKCVYMVCVVFVREHKPGFIPWLANRCVVCVCGLGWRAHTHTHTHTHTHFFPCFHPPLPAPLISPL